MTNTSDSKTEVTSYQYFEALSRTHTTIVLFDSLILAHPAICDSSEFRQKAEKISNDLRDLYQLLSSKHDSVIASGRREE